MGQTEPGQPLARPVLRVPVVADRVERGGIDRPRLDRADRVAHGGDAGELQPSSEAVEETPAQIPTGPRRVLVADDDALTLRMVTAIVEMEGYEVVAVADGREALSALQHDATFSAAIFDMRMPHLQGLDLILYMKADEQLRHIPVGMITAERDPKVWDESVAAGVCVFLPKPFTPPQVQMMLRMLESKVG